MQWDDHASGEAYLRTPQDDSLRDIMRDVLAMEQAAGVRARRRLGLSLAAYLRLREQGDEAQWGSEWIETQAQGPQGWLPASMCDQSLFESLASLGLRWVCIGSSSGTQAERLCTASFQAGLSVALRPSPAALEVIERHGPDHFTLESLPQVMDAHIFRDAPEDCPHNAGEAIRRLSDAKDAQLTAAVEWIISSKVPLVPLITMAERQTSLRAPGALRLGGKEASTHLGIPILDSRAQRQATVGIEHCRTALRHLINAKHPLLVGSGAPGTGLAPGFAWHDEIAVFKEMGWSYAA